MTKNDALKTQSENIKSAINFLTAISLDPSNPLRTRELARGKVEELESQFINVFELVAAEQLTKENEDDK